MDRIKNQTVKKIHQSAGKNKYQSREYRIISRFTQTEKPLMAETESFYFR